MRTLETREVQGLFGIDTQLKTSRSNLTPPGLTSVEQQQSTYIRLPCPNNKAKEKLMLTNPTNKLRIVVQLFNFVANG